MQLLRKKEPKELNGDTPVWFKIWHGKYFIPSDNRSRRTERWVTAIILIALGSLFTGRGYSPQVVEYIKSLFG